MKEFFSLFNLGDRYDIQAKVLPAAVVVIPIMILVLQVDFITDNWVGNIGVGVGLEVFLAIIVSFIGRNLGVRFEGRYKKKSGGLPTHRWVQPENHEHSDQQKQLWIKQLEMVSGLDIRSVIVGSDNIQTIAIINDAVNAVRGKIRNGPRGPFLLTQNIWYGAARNLAGLRWIFIIITLLCFGASIYGAWQHELPLGGTIILGLIFLISLVSAFNAGSYVNHTATRYAEAFYEALEADQTG